MSKPYKWGMVVGRFQMFHLGHQRMINIALNLCEQVLIFVGSSQESGTKINPFSFPVRAEMIRKAIPQTDCDYWIAPLPDMEDKTNSSSIWGQYVFNKFKNYTGTTPDLIVCGEEEERKDWFSEEMLTNTCVLTINRSPISATKLRDYMWENNEKEWKKGVNPRLYLMYSKLRELLLAATGNPEEEDKQRFKEIEKFYQSLDAIDCGNYQKTISHNELTYYFTSDGLATLCLALWDKLKERKNE